MDYQILNLLSLENKECVVRTRDEADKRIKRLSLTAVGRGKVAELVDIHNNRLHDIMTCLSKEEQFLLRNSRRRRQKLSLDCLNRHFSEVNANEQ